MRRDIRRDIELQKEFVKGVKEGWVEYNPITNLDFDEINIMVIGSGSTGNCFFVSNNTQEVSWLFDIGVPLAKIRSRVSLGQISKIYITHDHGDHMGGYIQAKNHFRSDKFVLPTTPCKNISTFNLKHSNTDGSLTPNRAYIVHNVLYITDFGTSSLKLEKWIAQHIKNGQIHHILIEGNYCKHELWENPKSHNAERTSDDTGHLSWSELFYLIKGVNDILMGEGYPIIHNSKGNIPFTSMHLSTSAFHGYGENCPFRLDGFNQLDRKRL